MTLDTLVARGEQLNHELGREWYLTGAGHKPEADFQAIYDRHLILQDEEALAVVRGANEPALLEWIVDLRVGRRVAPYAEQQLAWEQQAVVTVGDRTVPFLRAGIEIQNAADRAWRTALDHAATAVGAAGLNGLRRDRLAAEREVVSAAVGNDDYVAAVAHLSGMDLERLAEQAEALLGETADLYGDALARLTRRRIGVPLDALVRADSGWAFRADDYDAAFPSDRLVEIAVRQMGEMGLDATEAGRVHVDTEERPGKQPRAFCVPVRVPDEVYLVLRPSGGHSDYRTFWHELGHAMHFAAVDPDRAFHERWLGDNSVTEAFAMLWDHLTLDAGWLGRHTAMGQGGSAAAGQIADLQFELAVAELYLLRRYAAKLAYEIALHRSDYREEIADEYAERLTAATGFRYPRELYLRDVDPGFYSARYLRAWQLEAALARALVEQFDIDWFRNPRAGAFVRELMRRGQADPADRVAAEIGVDPLSFDAAVERLTPLLA
ncbi:MAG: M3 family metallopeptidase [Gemmatimonadota bacterium]|nr:M3 family metallopeptidase [Gemmatimonadota bacterium]MDH5197560.1 M3 family metallopeptidase [Gemmatimonadota bacterium]